MLPLRDNAAQRRFTVINSVLIVANAAVFIYEFLLGAGGLVADFIGRYAMVPARIVAEFGSFDGNLAFRPSGPLWAPLTIATSMFIHGSALHLLGNALYLFIFGAAVESRLGSGRFLGFYLASGIASAIATILIA